MTYSGPETTVTDLDDSEDDEETDYTAEDLEYGVVTRDVNKVVNLTKQARDPENPLELVEELKEGDIVLSYISSRSERCGVT